MCGILGFFPKKGRQINPEKLLFLSVLLETRGTDSTGIAFEDLVTKELGSARDFMVKYVDSIRAARREGRLKDKRVILHTRKASWATTITKDNAHPFKWGNSKSFFVGCHNGTLSSLWDTLKYIKPHIPDASYTTYPVDSICLLDALRLNPGAERNKVLSEYEGAAALIFMDNENFYIWKGALNNVEERPMYVGESPEGWYFTSIESSLELIKCTKIETIPNNCLVTIDREGNFSYETFVREKKIHVYGTTMYGGYGTESHVPAKKHTKTVEASDWLPKEGVIKMKIHSEDMTFIDKYGKKLDSFYLFNKENKEFKKISGLELVEAEHHIFEYIDLGWELLYFHHGVAIDYIDLKGNDFNQVKTIIGSSILVQNINAHEAKLIKKGLYSPLFIKGKGKQEKSKVVIIDKDTNNERILDGSISGIGYKMQCFFGDITIYTSKGKLKFTI